MGQFDCTTRILMGDAGTYLKGLEPKRLLMVADPFFRNGTAQKLAEAAKAQTEFFFEVEPNPSVTLAAKGAAVLSRFQPDAVVALGGGSAMDLAKAMLWLSDSQAYLIAIPTTSGSGSEVTDFAVLTHEDCKHPLVDNALRPRYAILDVSLVGRLPPGLVAEGGFDAISHAMEAYVATTANSFSDALAASALRSLLNNLEPSFRGDQTARCCVHQAATMAGLAFAQSGLGLCHALSHSLGGRLHISHGRLNGILLPHVMEANMPVCADRYAELARQAGLEGRSDTMAVRNLKNAVLTLRQRLELPVALPREFGVTQDLVEDTLADPCCKTNPLSVTREAVRQVLHRAVRHG